MLGVRQYGRLLRYMIYISHSPNILLLTLSYSSSDRMPASNNSLYYINAATSTLSFLLLSAVLSDVESGVVSPDIFRLAFALFAIASKDVPLVKWPVG